MGGYLLDRPVEAKEAAERVLGTLPALKARRRERASVLSGGERRLLEISRALIMDPDVVLIDEPSIGLEPRAIDMIFDTLRELRDEGGKTLILVEQNARKGLEFADIGYVLVAGRVVKAGRGEGAARRSRHGAAVSRRVSYERVAGVDRRLARPRRLLEQRAGLRCLGGAAERPGDQPPLLVGREHPAGLKPGDERGVIGEEIAPQRPRAHPAWPRCRSRCRSACVPSLAAGGRAVGSRAALSVAAGAGAAPAGVAAAAPVGGGRASARRLLRSCHPPAATRRPPEARRRREVRRAAGSTAACRPAWSSLAPRRLAASACGLASRREVLPRRGGGSAALGLLSRCRRRGAGGIEVVTETAGGSAATGPTTFSIGLKRVLSEATWSDNWRRGS